MSATRFVLAVVFVIVLATAFPLGAHQPQVGLAGNVSSARGSDPAASNLWRQTLQVFDEWGQFQQIYTPTQIAEIRRKMLDKAANLSPADSEQFRGEIDAKLHVLMSAEARDARKWLTDTLAVASDSYAKKIRSQLPDVVNESAPQLQADLDAFEAREASVKQYQQGFQQTRQMQVKALEEDARRQAEANAAAHVGSNYNPAPGGAAIGGPGAYQRYRSPYGPTLPSGFGWGYRFW
jgi:hypothetical protein